MTRKDDILKELLKIPDIVLWEKRKLASGKISDYYIDIKVSYGYVGILCQYANYILNSLGHEISKISCVIGSGHGGIPLVTTITLCLNRWDVKSAFVRDTPKNHGKQTMVDGFPLEKLSERAKVLIVDDVFTTGESIRKIIAELPESINYKIFVICNRSGIKNPEINGVKVNYIFTEEDLVPKRQNP